MNKSFLQHHGILGQKWGEKNGPPYPLKGGDYSSEERKKILKNRQRGNSIYNKKHYDEVLKKGTTTLSTLSYDPNRTKGADMFYATHNRLDKHQYNAMFNNPIPKEIIDENGKNIGTGQMYKYRIDNKLNKDLKIASEDSGAEVFAQLYKKDRDFYNFVNDDNRMQKYFVDSKYKFRGYRESRKMLEKMDDKNYIPTESELKKTYRMFNYVIPYDGGGNDNRGKNDVLKQRAKFFNALKQEGYGAVLDTNDAIYGGFKAKSPIIVFDVKNIVPDKVYQTTKKDKTFSTMVTVGRKFLGKW